jgi:hypothetical protein
MLPGTKALLGSRSYRWSDVEAFLTREQVAAARRKLRQLRLRPDSSKYWLSGYPLLVAEWHPTKNGEIFPDIVSFGSNRHAWWRCADEKHSWRARVNNRVRGARCPYCANQLVSSTNNLAVRYPKLAEQWHPTRNGSLTARGVLPGTKRKVWWKCSAGPDHEWRSAPDGRLRGSGCPFCGGKRVSVVNNLAVRRPDLAVQWHAKRNGPRTPASVVCNSTARVWWQCPRELTHVWATTVHARASRPRGCPFCSGHRVSQTNSLAIGAPAIAREWHQSRNGALSPGEVLSPTLFRDRIVRFVRDGRGRVSRSGPSARVA